MNIITWIVTNWAYILSALFGVVVVASIIVRLTPNEKDDAIVTKIVNVLDHFSVAKTENDKKMIEIAKDYLNKESK